MSFNRNIVECKDLQIIHRIIRIPVLIETLWNVKKDADLVILGTGTVLIETLWNVKADQSTDSGD